MNLSECLFKSTREVKNDAFNLECCCWFYREKTWWHVFRGVLKSEEIYSEETHVWDVRPTKTCSLLQNKQLYNRERDNEDKIFKSSPLAWCLCCFKTNFFCYNKKCIDRVSISNFVTMICCWQLYLGSYDLIDWHKY